MQTYSSIVEPATPADATLASSDAGVRRHMDGLPDTTPLMLPTTGPVSIQLPMSVSVAQVGEINPPQSMLDTLRKQRNLFWHVSPQSGIVPRPDQDDHDRLARMRLMAQNVGADYLLIFGGNIDSGQQGTGLSILNLTIIGAFIVPSTGVAVEGKAAGSLVDVHTGRVVMSFSSETKGNGLVPTAFAENSETISIATAKDDLVKKLTQDVIAQLESPSKPVSAMVK